MANPSPHDIEQGAIYIRLQIIRKNLRNHLVNSPERIVSLDAGFLVDLPKKVYLQYYLAVASDGRLFKPMIIVPRQKEQRYKDAFLERGILNEVILFPYNGQATGLIVLKYMKYILEVFERDNNRITPDNKLLIISDEASTHKTTEADSLCLLNGIEIIRLRKESHVLFNPVERIIRKIKTRSLKYHLDYKEVAMIFEAALDFITANKVQKSFRSSGWPFKWGQVEELVK